MTSHTSYHRFTRTVFVLWLRQIKRHFRSRARVVGSLMQPTLFLVALGFGLGPVFARAGEGDYIAFLAPGIVGMSIIFTAMFSGIEIIWDKQFGFLKETMVAPVSRFSIMLGRTAGGATVAAFQGSVVLLIASLIGFRPVSLWAIIPAVFAMFLVGLFFSAVGTAIASRLEDMQGFQLVMNFLIMPLFFLSGAMFPLDTVPPALLAVARFDPLAYGVDAFRGLLSGTAHFGVGFDFLVLSVITVIALSLGAWLFSRMEV
jgi:ABC-2 type transport system permease protein